MKIATRPSVDPKQSVAGSGPGSDELNQLPDWYRHAVIYHIQTLGFFGAEGMPNDPNAEPADRLASLRDWCVAKALDLSYPGMRVGTLRHVFPCAYDCFADDEQVLCCALVCKNAYVAQIVSGGFGD